MTGPDMTARQTERYTHTQTQTDTQTQWIQTQEQTSDIMYRHEHT